MTICELPSCRVSIRPDIHTPDQILDIYRQDGWEVVRGYREFCEWIERNGLPDVVSFDYQLAGDKTRFDCAQFMIKYINQHNLGRVPIWYVHSTHPKKGKIIELIAKEERRLELLNKKADLCTTET